MDLDEFLAAEDAVASSERARSRARVLHAELSAEQATCSDLQDRLEAIRRRDRRSARSWWQRLRGRRPDPAAPPTADVSELTAQLSVHERTMQRLSAEFAAARDEASGLDAARARLHAAREARARAIADDGDDRARRLADLDRDLADARRTHDERSAALASALDALRALESAIDRLGTAAGWSALDVVSDGSGGFRHGSARLGGDVAGRAKHDSLDAAVVPLAAAHAALLSLRSELADLGESSAGVHRPNVTLPSSNLTTWDVWFDNTFSDLMVHGRITSSIGELERAGRSVEELVGALRPGADAAAARVAELEAGRDALLRT